MYIEVPSKNTCAISEPPPKVPEDALPSDIAKPGEFGCDDRFEVCMTRKVAVWVLRLHNWADEWYARCQQRPSS